MPPNAGRYQAHFALDSLTDLVSDSIDGRKVPQLVVRPFNFRLGGTPAGFRPDRVP